MKMLKVLGFSLLAILVIASAIYIFLPSRVYMQRSIIISAQPEKIFNVIDQLEDFNEWSPWFQEDPDAFYTLDGPEHGVGAKLSWESTHKNIGAGTMIIVASEPEHLVRYKLQFGNTNGESFADYILEKLDSTTQITWTFEEKVHGMEKFHALGINALLGPEYEQGLINLKKYVENLPDYHYDISIQNIDSIQFIGMEASLEGDEISLLSTKTDQMFDNLDQLVEEKKLEITGQRLCRYHAITADRIDFEVGVPVSALPDLKNSNFTRNIITGGKAVVAIHKGSYANLADTYREINKYMMAKHLKPAGDMWEVYVTDPAMEPDTSQWITNVYFKFRN